MDMDEEDGDDYHSHEFLQNNSFDDNDFEEDIQSSDNVADDLENAIRDAQQDCESEKDRIKFERMLEDHNKLLYPNCEDGQKKLGTTLELLQWKAKNGVSDKAFEQVLQSIKKMLPKGDELSSSTYEAKQILCPLGLEMEKIHACPNDCILYRGEEYENMDACPVCHASRYKIKPNESGDVEGERQGKKSRPR